MGKIAIVTGASAGVGRATARELARRGWDLGLIARGREGLEAARREAEGEGVRALALPLDVADPDAVEQAAARVEAELGPIDVWVNVAMVSVFAPVKDLAAEEVRRVTEVTYLGYVNGTLAALRRMLPRDRGHVVQVGSALGHRGIPLQAAYCAAKHAVKGFTDSLRVELRHDGSRVRVSELILPAHNTPQFRWSRSRMPREAQPVPPIFQPEVAARAVAEVIRRPRPVVYVAWPALQAVWGSRLLRPLVDVYLAYRGYEQQMTDEPRKERPDNLFAPVGGDHGAHGVFDGRAKQRSLMRPLARRKGWLAAAAALVGAAALARRS